MDLTYRCLDCGRHDRILADADLGDVLSEIKEYILGVTVETPDSFMLTVEVRDVRSGHVELGAPTVPVNVNGRHRASGRRAQQ